MARNHLEERLEVIRNQKSMLRLRMKEETDRKKLMKLTDDFRELTKEENDCLSKMGVFK